jgi:8-oxo-dGTP pyrophosphatase MutT (NUDIX family)
MLAAEEARMPDLPVVPRLAATIVLARDGASGLEIFMVQRHHEIDFATGAMVFPGGKLDPDDADASLREYARGAEALDDDGFALRVAAIRETFEECGILLAREEGSDELLGAERLRELEGRYRESVHDGKASMLDLVTWEGVELACDVLVPFAHWITPAVVPKRFDTYFFVAAAPPDQLAVHDGHESVDSLWIHPSDAEREAEAGRRTIIFPTLMNLQKLALSASTDELIENARANPVVTVRPEIGSRDDGVKVVRLPREAGYPNFEVPISQARGA